jgi:hypothetical protein
MGSPKFWIFALVAVLVVGVLVSAGAFSETPKAFCPDEYDSDDVANSSLLDDQAEPLSPTGPRPVRIFEVHADEPLLGRADAPEEGTMSDITFASGSLPDAWDPKDKVQVLVCQYRHDVGNGQSSGCPGVEVLAATYTYKVYEADSKDELGTFDIKGTERNCSGIIVHRKGTQPRDAFDPDMGEVIDRLRPYAEPAR